MNPLRTNHRFLLPTLLTTTKRTTATTFYPRHPNPTVNFSTASTVEEVDTRSPRDPTFSRVTEADLTYFRNLLGEQAILTSTSDLESLNTDWMRRYHGSSTLALKPCTIPQISSILSYCNDNHLAVVPQGGNTGLVGGSVPVHDEIILSLSSLNKIESFDVDSGIVTTQSGVILETLDKYVNDYGFRVPLDLGAKGSCQIGGNVSTNAGGSRFIRYGSLRSSVLGLEVVLPDGRILSDLRGLRKDNTGYDLKQLFIGSEGTLGIITRIALACPVLSKAIDVVVLRVDNFDKVIKLLKIARENLNEVLSAFEYLDNESLTLATKHLSHISNPLPDDDEIEDFQNGGGLILIECAGNDSDTNRQKLENFLEIIMEQEIISNGVIAENQTQTQAMWELRESLPEAILKSAGNSGITLKYDISLPLNVFHKCLSSTRKKIEDIPNVHVAGWGHVGDGNLHLNIAVEDGAHFGRIVKQKIEPWIYEFVQEFQGSVSAEHGLGVMKSNVIGYSKSDIAVDIMRNIKHVLDPNGVCNPYKVLPEI